MADDRRATTERTDVVRAGRPLWLIGALVVLGFGLALAVVRPGDTDEVSEPSTTAPPVSAPIAPSTIVSQPDAPRGVASVGRAVLVRAVLSTPIGLDPRLVTWSGDGSVAERDLPPLFDYSLDTSGRWLAALDRPLGTADPDIPEPATLWVGQVDGEMAPVADDVVSFAWHQSDPGSLAWHAVDGEPLIVTATAGQRSDGSLVVVSETPVAPDGFIAGWGPWGYAIELPGRSVVVGVDGSTVVELDGNVSGAVEHRLLVSDFRRPPALVDAVSGVAAPVPWLADAARVSALASAPGDDTLLALQTIENSFAGLGTGRILLVDVDASAETVVGTWSAPGPTGLAWDPSGRFVVFARQGPLASEPELVLVMAGGGEDRPITVDALAKTDWVQTVAVG